MKSSQDGGITWGKMTFVSPVDDKGNPKTHYAGGTGIYHTQSKTLVLQYNYIPSGDSTKTKDNKLYQITSSDNAKSWSKPQDITHVMEPCRRADGSLPHAGAGNRIQTPSGRLIFGVGIPSMCLWYSDDGGKTYNNTGYKEHTSKINEFSIVVANSKTGLLLANSRGQPYRKSYWSSDNGKTWSKPEDSQLKDSVNKHNHGCEASMTNIGDKLFFFNPTGQGDDARTKMAVRCSSDGGLTWPSKYDVQETDDGGYSDLIYVENGKGNHLLLAWGYMEQKTNMRNIHLEHIDLKWCK